MKSERTDLAWYYKVDPILITVSFIQLSPLDNFPDYMGPFPTLKCANIAAQAMAQQISEDLMKEISRWKRT